MAYVVPSAQENLNFLNGTTNTPPIITSSAPAGAPAGPAGGSPQGPAQSAQGQQGGTTLALGAERAQPAQAGFGFDVGIERQGSIYDRLFNPVSRGLERGQQELQNATSSFYQAAGSRRNFEDLGGLGAVNQYLQTGAREGDILDWANAAYTGPSSLDYSGPYQGQLRERANALTGGNPLQSLLQASVPGLTSGQARFEARNLLGQDDYRMKAENFRRSIDDYFAKLSSEQEKASSYAGARAQEEGELREKTRGAVTEAHDTKLSELAKRAEEINQYNRTANEIMARFNEGTLDPQTARLAGFDDELQAIHDTEFMKRQAEAQLAELDKKYADVAHIPFAEPRRHHSGAENRVVNLGGTEWDLLGLIKGYPQDEEGRSRGSFTFGEEWRDAGMPQNMSFEEAKALGERLLERQAEYERYFAPATTRGDVYADLAGMPDILGANAPYQRADLAVYNPAFWGDVVSDPNLQFRDAREYVTFDPGLQAHQTNVAEEAERQLIERAAKALGINAPAWSEEAARRALLEFDVGAFQGDFARTKAEREKALDQKSQWLYGVLDHVPARPNDLAARHGFTSPLSRS